ncbi:MAG TPA: hypothetical protein PK400_07405 [Phycisphaerales bacterium]|nr:hypothetical protein [Phycisphaerales bacterium]
MMQPDADNNASTHAPADPLLDFLTGSMSPAELAAQLGASLRDAAELAHTPHAIAMAEAVARLHDLQAQMLLSRYRTTILAKMIALATQDDSPAAERARMLLLKLNFNVFAPRRAKSPASPPAAPTPEAILGAFERIAAAPLASVGP